MPNIRNVNNTHQMSTRLIKDSILQTENGKMVDFDFSCWSVRIICILEE